MSCKNENENENHTMIVYGCNCEQKQQVAKDIKESIKNANNMSDEEMEDVIIQLERTYVRTHCNQVKVKAKNNGGYLLIDQVDSLTYYNY